MAKADGGAEYKKNGIMTRVIGHDSICCPGLPFVSDFPARPQAPEYGYAHEADV